MFRFKKLIGLISLLGLISPILSQAQVLQFSRTLQFGSSGSDVRQLQIFLNRNPKTKIAEEGPGSPGNETSYFGSATRAAVIQYQRVYAEEVLVPAGTITPTGIVGPLTRAKLNSQSAGARSMVSQDDSAGKSAVVLTEIQPTRGGYGTTITLTGSGFSKNADNSIYAGYHVFRGITSPDGTSLSFTIPADIPDLHFDQEDLADVPDASLPFWIYVHNALGDSDSQLFTFTFYTK